MRQWMPLPRMDLHENLTSESDTDYENGEDFQQLPFISRFILVFTSFMIITSNILVLAVFLRMHSSLTKMQLFLQSLAIADLLVGLMWFILHFEGIVGMDLYTMSNWLCLMVVHMPAIALMVSVLTLSLISIERYIAVVKPFHYHKLITRSRAKQAVVAVWVLSTVLFIPVYIPLLLATSDVPQQSCENDFKNVLYTCLYMMTIIIIPNVFLSLYCYVCIVRNIFHRDKILNRHQSSVRRRGSRRLNERALAKISISVYSGFYITWLPFVVVSFMAYVDLLDVSDVLYHSTLNFGLWNSLLNCLIYSISHKPFRRELKLLLLSTVQCCCCSGCCVKGTTQKNATSKKCCQVAVVHHSPKISKDTRDSLSSFNMNKHIAKEIMYM